MQIGTGSLLPPNFKNIYGSITSRVGSGMKSKFIKTLSTGKLLIGGRAMSLSDFKK